MAKNGNIGQIQRIFPTSIHETRKKSQRNKNRNGCEFKSMTISCVKINCELKNEVKKEALKVIDIIATTLNDTSHHLTQK